MTDPYTDVVEVVAERPRADRRETLGAGPHLGRGERDDLDPLPVADALGDDPVPGVQVEQRDDVRDRCERLPVLEHDEVLVLELQPEEPTLVRGEALDQCGAADETAAGAPLDVDDLALTEPGQRRDLPDRGERVLAPAPDRLAHPDGPRHRAGDGRSARGPGRHRVEAAAGGPTERRHAVADEPFEPDVVAGVEHDGLQPLVGDHRRRAGHPVQVRGEHLQLGEGTAHEVRVEQRQAGVGGPRDRQYAVDPAHLERHHRGDVPAETVLVGLADDPPLRPVRNLLHHDRRGPDHPARHDQVVVGERLQRQYLDGSEPVDRLHRHELADARVPAAAPGEDGAAQGECR